MSSITRATIANLFLIVTLAYEKLVLLRVHHYTRALIQAAVLSTDVSTVQRHSPPCMSYARPTVFQGASAWDHLRQTILCHCSWSMMFSLPCFLAGISVHNIAHPSPALQACAKVVNIVGAIGMFDAVYISFMANSVHLLAERQCLDDAALTRIAKVLAVPVSDAPWSLIWLIISSCMWGTLSTLSGGTQGQPSSMVSSSSDPPEGEAYTRSPINEAPSTILNFTLSGSPDDSPTAQFFPPGPWWMYAIPLLFLVAAVIRTIMIMQAISLGKHKPTDNTHSMSILPVSFLRTTETIVGLARTERNGGFISTSTLPVMNVEAEPATILQSTRITSEPESIFHAHVVRLRSKKDRADSAPLQKNRLRHTSLSSEYCLGM